MRPKIIFKKDKSGYYVAEVPALPGCVSQGRTLAQAKINIQQAIIGWMAVKEDQEDIKIGRNRLASFKTHSKKNS